MFENDGEQISQVLCFHRPFECSATFHDHRRHDTNGALALANEHSMHEIVCHGVSVSRDRDGAQAKVAVRDGGGGRAWAERKSESSHAR